MGALAWTEVTVTAGAHPLRAYWRVHPALPRPTCSIVDCPLPSTSLSDKIKCHDLVVVVRAPPFRCYLGVSGGYVPRGTRLVQVTDKRAEADRRAGVVPRRLDVVSLATGYTPDARRNRPPDDVERRLRQGIAKDSPCLRD